MASKKDYENVSYVIAKTWVWSTKYADKHETEVIHKTLKYLISQVGIQFSNENPRFNQAEFERNLGIPDKV